MSQKEEDTKSKPKISKVKRLEEALKEEREKSSEYLNRLLYLQADFENYRKRAEKEIREAIQMGNERLITNLLSILDDLEMAVKSGKESVNKEALLQGVEMILKKMYATLGQEGLTKIEATGKPFDPARHEAIQRVPTDKYAEGIVIEEVRKGFMLKDRVIRPSIVKVALTPNVQLNQNPKEVT